jgi:CHASE2 domain-containing sensor protein
MSALLLILLVIGLGLTVALWVWLGLIPALILLTVVCVVVGLVIDRGRRT